MHARFFFTLFLLSSSLSLFSATDQPAQPDSQSSPTPAASASPKIAETNTTSALPTDPLSPLAPSTAPSPTLSPAALSVQPEPETQLLPPPSLVAAATTPLPSPSAPQPKEATTPIPPNALARLRAARAKLQALKATADTEEKPSPSPQPSDSAASELTSVKTTSPAISAVTSTNTPSAPALATPTTIGAAAPAANPAANIAPVNLNEKISMQFPHTSIMEVLALYEKLTGKHIIRDSNLTGPELSIMITDPISKKEAINIIESSMLLNGYVVVPTDEKTIKVLGPNRPPRTEGLPLYLEESELPTEGDQLVSFYQPLHFLSTTEAINILQGVVQLNPFGSLVAVPNTSSIVITDKTPVIRKALALLKVIDHESSQIITEFVSLQRADAEKTVETLNQIFGREGSSSSATKGAGQAPNNPNIPTNQPNPAISDGSTPGDERVFSGKVQFIPDKRTNRILVVTRAENYRYVRELIANLDQAQTAEEPLVRPLNYMSASDVFPVLVDMLKNKDDETAQNAAKTQPTPQNAFNSNNSAGSQNPMDSSGVSAGGNHADRLNEAQKQAPPQSAIVGSTSILADPTANSIIVYGPPDSKAKARQIIELLDRRPQQVYLAAVIGEMKLQEGIDYGASYLFHYQGFQALANSFVGGPAAASLLNGINAAFPTNGTSSGLIRAAGINNTVGNQTGGLTLFGSIGGSVDTYANFLESTGKFRTISRPTVYTSNNKKATILSGRRVPYQSSSLSSVVAGATNQTANSITANVTYQDVLLKLEVIPLINSDKEVNLIIAQQNQSVDETATTKAALSGVNAPVVNTQELTTSVRIPSGSTIVLGGLISDEKATDDRGIPLINKIPVIGPLLGNHTTKNKLRRELVIMIQPIVIDSNAAMEKVSDRQGGTTDLGMEAKGLEKKLLPTPTPSPTKKKFQLFKLPKMKNY